MLKLESHKFFIYCALIIGIIMITLIPPFQSPDEDSHFKKAYVVSRGDLYPHVENGAIGFYLPNEMSRYIHEKNQYMGNLEKKYTYKEMIFEDKLPADYSEQSFQVFSTVKTTPFAYIAPAIGIIVSKIVNFIMGIQNVSVVNMLYFARFFCLLLYIILVAIAIKITPILKKSFCIIGLIPMSLALAACVSYDSVIIATCLLATALIFKLIFDDSVKKVNYKYIIAFGLIGFILLSIKTVYITVLLPLIFVPKEKYGGNIKGIIKTLSIIGAIAIGIFILNKLPTMMLNYENGDSIAINAQTEFVKEHPLYYMKIWLNTMFSNRNFIILGIFGTFGLLDTNIASVYMMLYILAFLAIIIADTSLTKKVFNWKYKGIAILGAIASVFGIFLAMYLMWTSVLPGYGVGANTITGVQGRYFLPLLPLIIVIITNGVLQKNEKIKKVLTKILDNTYIVAFTMLLVSCIAILLRFWC